MYNLNEYSIKNYMEKNSNFQYKFLSELVSCKCTLFLQLLKARHFPNNYGIKHQMYISSKDIFLFVYIYCIYFYFYMLSL